MPIITNSWLKKTTGSRALEELFAMAADNIPTGYANCPWIYPGIDHGKGILENDAQLNCYIHAYGLMHVCKLWKALEYLPLDAVCNGFEIIDWGCGQGLATLTLLAWLKKYFPERSIPQCVTILDLSSAALSRAQNFVGHSLFGNQVGIEAIPIDLSQLNYAREAYPRSSKPVVHLFSNIIDVPRICHTAIAQVISESKNQSFVVCVGHHATANDAAHFSRILGIHHATSLHHENTPYGAQLSNGKQFGWDITIMQYARMAKAA